MYARILVLLALVGAVWGDGHEMSMCEQQLSYCTNTYHMSANSYYDLQTYRSCVEGAYCDDYYGQKEPLLRSIDDMMLYYDHSMGNGGQVTQLSTAAFLTGAAIALLRLAY